MKRVKAACICQTLHFMLKDDLGHDYAVKLVKEEVEKYKASLDKSSTTQVPLAIIWTEKNIVTTQYSV